MTDLILIAGPTACGKSRLALELAQKRNGVVINADAMQVYQGLPILTAQPGANDLKAQPHRLYGFIDPAKHFSVADWATVAQQVIVEVMKQERVPILVGGTGLYFKALLEGLSDIPTIPELMRQKAKALREELGPKAFHAELAKRDPAIAKKLAPGDKQRTLRAYEVWLHTGTPLSEWQKRGGKKPPLYKVEAHLILPERALIHANINQRFDQMIKEGALDEAKAFMKRKLPEELPANKVLGLRELSEHLKRRIPLAEAKELAKIRTRQYAKRQSTWFRNQWDWKKFASFSVVSEVG